jgi:hypothetical protein
MDRVEYLYLVIPVAIFGQRWTRLKFLEKIFLLDNVPYISPIGTLIRLRVYDVGGHN